MRVSVPARLLPREGGLVEVEVAARWTDDGLPRPWLSEWLEIDSITLLSTGETLDGYELSEDLKAYISTKLAEAEAELRAERAWEERHGA